MNIYFCRQLDDSVISSVRMRSLNLNINSTERRKSKKQQMKEKGNIDLTLL